MEKKKKKRRDKRQPKIQVQEKNEFHFWNKIIFIAILVFAGMFFSQKIYFINADIGRHIRNGEYFFKVLFPVSTNFYSYTEPNLFVVNHHWASGAVFYGVWKLFGFSGISFFNILLYVAAFAFFFKTAEKLSGFKYACVFSILSVPLISFRTEIRPEVFSFLFLGVYYYVLQLFDKKKLSFKRLLIVILPLQLFWVNMHIFFVLGIFLIGVFWLNSIMNANRKDFRGYYFGLGFSVLLVSFLNPFGIRGFLEPFLVLKEYGYMIAENQSVFFMQKRFPLNFRYVHFEVLFLFIASVFTLRFFKGRKRFIFKDFLLMFSFSVLSWRMIRGIPIFGFFFIPIGAVTVYQLMKEPFIYRYRRVLKKTGICACSVMIAAFIFSGDQAYSPLAGKLGLGLYPGVNASADFLKNVRIKGPILNNYDIGGYLIFHLFPGYRVFVDNRPEAYTVAFFKEEYEPLQEHENKWREIDKKYGFNCICFYRHDMTPHAQPFLIKRIEDPEWIPVFVDDYAIILLKQNKQNEEIIRRYELPQSMFKITHN
ncbi:MAG: hypothetical protein ABH869_07315 [Candidatus Omnitrophota bacterium]